MSENNGPSVSELSQWLGEQTWSDFAMSLADQFDRKGSLSEKQIAAGRRMMAKCKARASRPTSAPITDDGMYQMPDGTVVKVQRSRTSGRLYGKVLELVDGKGQFSYAGGIMRDLDPSMKMDGAAAAQWGQLYGVCCVCAAVLTDEDSIARGIGPICASKF